MVRNYVRKTKQASWNETGMKEAILAVKTSTMGLRKAARTFDLPKDSLRHRLQKLYLVDLEICCLKAKKKS